jgi:hypothetical protein
MIRMMRLYDETHRPCMMIDDERRGLADDRLLPMCR